MFYRINSAAAHPDRTVAVTSPDGVTARIDLGPVVAKGNVRFAARMQVAADRLGLEWPNRVDLSADGLRFRAFPEEAAAGFEAVQPARSAMVP